MPVHIHPGGQVAVALGDVAHAAAETVERQNDLELQHPPGSQESAESKRQHHPAGGAGAARPDFRCTELFAGLLSDQSVQVMHRRGQVIVVRRQRGNPGLQVVVHVLFAGDQRGVGLVRAGADARELRREIVHASREVR